MSIDDRGESNGHLYFSMEFIPGKTLRQILNTGPLAPYTALHLLHWLNELLHFIQARGFIHRDLKLENLMFRYSKLPEINWCNKPDLTFFERELLHAKIPSALSDLSQRMLLRDPETRLSNYIDLQTAIQQLTPHCREPQQVESKRPFLRTSNLSTKQD